MQLTPHEKIIDEEKFLNWNKSVAEGMSKGRGRKLANPYLNRIKQYGKIKSEQAV